MKEKNIILTARVLSMILTPFYLPFVAMVALFIFSYLSILDLGYKVIVLTLIYAMTILLPTLLIHIYRNYQGRTSKELGVKERRMIPYIISIMCYFLCFYVMNIFHMPAFMGSIVVAALCIQIVCAIINIWWKISTHTAAIGGFFGALMPHDTAPAHALTGGAGLSHGSRCGIHHVFYANRLLKSDNSNNHRNETISKYHHGLHERYARYGESNEMAQRQRHSF